MAARRDGRDVFAHPRARFVRPARWRRAGSVCEAQDKHGRVKTLSWCVGAPPFHAGRLYLHVFICKRRLLGGGAAATQRRRKLSF